VRSKDPMEGLCKERLITKEACDWVKYALDPFHDLQLEHLRGYPDVSTEPTVIVKIRQAMTVTAPPGLGDTESPTWDCHIVASPIDYMPMDSSSVHTARVFPHGDTVPAASDASAGAVHVVNAAGSPIGRNCARMDGLLINSVPSTGAPGTEYTYTPGHCPATAGQGYQLQHINLDNYLDFENTDLGVYRLVYSGFEVVNTTAQIYKQGAVTVYEYGNSFEVGASHPTYSTVETGPGGGTTPYPDHRPTNYFRCPPNTLAEAKIMPGSHSWAAQEGCYNTAKFQTDNPFQGLTSRPWVISQNNMDGPESSGFVPFDPSATPLTYNSGSFVSEYPLGFVDQNSVLPYRNFGGPVHFSRMNTTGAYFTGLSPETTLFVTWRVGIERLPAANKPAFLALSQPSAAYDPNALVLYNLVANALPPGCPQGYNDAGKWFRWIADQAKKAIPTVYPAVRTAAMVANSMGRPVIGAALTGLANQLEGPAKKAAAQRIQAAARKQQQAQTKNGQRKPAVGNWSQPGPTPRPGGTNGLK
jgi:hypothetical protein